MKIIKKLLDNNAILMGLTFGHILLMGAVGYYLTKWIGDWINFL